VRSERVYAPFLAEVCLDATLRAVAAALLKQVGAMQELSRLRRLRVSCPGDSLAAVAAVRILQSPVDGAKLGGLLSDALLPARSNIEDAEALICKKR